MRAALVIVCLSGAGLPAQAPKGGTAAVAFRARLSPAPIDLSMQATVSGSGSASAVLSGPKLSITGTFDGLKSPATVAALHRGPARGVRGPELTGLTVSHAASGTVSGTIELTPAQVIDLEKGRLYIQIHSEKAPDGNLWGWLLPQEARK
jgi:CHRD domain-containing protein